jgi:molybdate transport system substrate-binding protein
VSVRALCARNAYWRAVVLQTSRTIGRLVTLGLVALGFAALAIAPFPFAARAEEKAQNKTILIFAAASLKNALDAVDGAFADQTGIAVAASYDASSALMKQIEAGAPADIFISADQNWMDYGSRKKLIDDATRINLLGNKLVLIAGKASNLAEVTIGPGLDLAKLAGDGRIATGDARAVPVGIYAKDALQKLGLWSAVEPKLAMVGNVRAALVLVARGEAPLGIVYATDAKVEPAVKIIGVFPDDSHDPIVYPAAATIIAKPSAALYLAFLRSAVARSIFASFGFSFIAKPSS